LERWLSGLKYHLGKVALGKLNRGFESPSLRKIKTFKKFLNVFILRREETAE
jgi:hypothetical protein